MRHIHSTGDLRIEAPDGKNKRNVVTPHAPLVNITSPKNMIQRCNTTLHAHFNGLAQIHPRALKTASVEGVYFFLKDVLSAKTRSTH